jgi:hypothetical protein
VTKVTQQFILPISSCFRNCRNVTATSAGRTTGGLRPQLAS